MIGLQLKLPWIFLSKYTAPLKIQLIKRRLQIAAAAALHALERQRPFTLAFALTDAREFRLFVRSPPPRSIDFKP